MTTAVVRCELGPTTATVVADHPAIAEYLDHFYVLKHQATTVMDAEGWTIEAEVAAPDGAMQINVWGVGYQADLQKRHLRLRADDPQSLAITARKCVREVLVDYCERRRYVMLHASAVADDRTVIIIVGDKGSGKTTLALKAAVGHQMRYLSNDHLILYAAGETAGAGGVETRLTVTSLPTLIPVKIGTFLDMEASLPPPWSVEDLDVDAYRRVPREQLYGLDRRVLFTYRTLGHESPTAAALGSAETGLPTLIALARYARPAEGPVPEATPVADPVAALMPHVRTDWMFDPLLNQRYLPRHERSPAEYQADAELLVRALTDRARTVEWRHRGDPSELIGLAQTGKHS